MKKFNSILVCIGLLIIASTMVPFSSETIGANEGLIKFVLTPLVVLLIALLGIIGKDKKVEGKKGYYSAALLMSTYIASAFSYVAFFSFRCEDVFASENLPKLALSTVASLIFVIFALSLPKYEHRKALFMPLVIFFIIVSAECYLFATKVSGVSASSNYNIVFYASIALALFTTIFYFVEYFIVNKKLTETNMERDVVLYQEIMDDNLKDIYDYSKNALQDRGTVFEETKVEVVKEIPVEKIVDREIVREVPVERVVEKEVEVVKEVPIPQYVEKEVIKEVPVVKEVEVVKEVPVVKEVERVVEKVVEVIKEVPVVKEVEKVVVKEIPVEKVIEVVKEVPVDKVVQVVKEVPIDRIIEIEKPKKQTTPKPKLAVKPSAVDIALHAEKMFEDIKVVYGKDNENYKIMFHKKPIMMVASGASGYKVTFQRKPISATKLLVKYPSICQKATNPKGEQWFKITNKGDVEENDIYDLIKFSRKYTEDEEKAIIAKQKKEEEKIRLAEEKAKAKEEAAIKKQLEAEERAKQKAIEAEEKAKAKEEAKRIAAEQKAIQKAIEAEERAKAREEAKRLAKEEREKAKAEANAQANAQANAEKANAEAAPLTPADIQKEAIKEAVREALSEFQAENEDLDAEIQKEVVKEALNEYESEKEDK